MENGHDHKLAEKLSGMVLNDVTSSSPNNADNNNNNHSLFQVLKAVEAAEATIRQQAEENNRLRFELQKKLKEIEKSEVDDRRPVVENQVFPNASGDTPPLFLQSKYNTDNTVLRALAGTTASNVTLNLLHTSQQPSDSGFHSPLFSQSRASLSPPRFESEGEHDPRFNSSENGIMPIAETNTNSSLWKQVKEHEEEILQLRKQLAEYSVKEAQIRNEKYVLEKRIAYMRLAFDQQQQDLVDAASKALSYRQDIIEENIRLTYALQAAQQERTTFVSSLLPLLAEYSLQPAVPDAQSIVSNVKVLFKHLQEQLIFAESKIKESKYQLAPWRSDVKDSNFTQSSQPHSIGAALTTSIKNGLELVPQPMYSQGKAATNSRDGQIGPDWDILDHNRRDFGAGGAKNSEVDYFERYSPPVNRHSPAHDIPAQLASTRNDLHATQQGEESGNKQVTFLEPISNHDMDESDIEGHQNEREPSSNWSAGTSPYANTPDDPGSSYSPYLQPVMEEPSSSFSEDDDPLPAIEGLQISGEAYPGRELQACGYSINGTTSCNFEWVRHLEDGSVNYIDGAKQPTYLVTADDVDTYLAIEVQPLDNRKRKGELVKVFANDNKKIICDHEMQSHIEKTLYGGHASYKVQLSTGYLDIWEPATLSVKRDGFNIKCSGSSGIVVTEKYSRSVSVTVPYGLAAEFSIIGSNGAEHILRSDGSSEDGNCSRDTIVLTLRLFIMRAGERKKGKKKGFFKSGWPVA